MTDLALMQASGPDAVVARYGGTPIRLGRFLADVEGVRASLPDRRQVLNLCKNRYRFTVVFCAAVLRDQVNLLPPTVTPVVIDQIRRAFPDAYGIEDEPGDEVAMGAFAPAVLRYDDLCVDAAEPAEVPVIPGSREAAVVFTSGSTGMPTPSPKSWGSLAGSAATLAESFGLKGSGMTLLATVPPQHMYGIEASVFLPLQGLVLHSGRPFFPFDICAELAAMPRPRGLVTTPLHLAALLGGMNEFPALDFVLSSTAPLAPTLAIEAEKRLGAPLHEIYGCTEAGHVATRRPAVSPDWILSAGLVLRQASDGTFVSGGHVSEEVTLQDMLEVVDERRFRLLGRSADLVNIAGKRTSLAYLDHHLKSIGGVADGAFLLRESREGGLERLTAFAVAPGMHSRELMRELRQRIDAAFLPRPLVLVDSLPRNDTGKLPRGALEALAARFAAE